MELDIEKNGFSMPLSSPNRVNGLRTLHPEVHSAAGVETALGESLTVSEYRRKIAPHIKVFMFSLLNDLFDEKFR